MTRTIARFLGLIAVMFLFALPAAAQKPASKGKEQEGIKAYKLQEEPGTADTTPELVKQTREGKPLGVAEIGPRAGRMADQKLEEAIDTLNQLIDTADDDDPSKPEYLARLASLYWDKAENFFNKAYGDEMFLRLKAAQETGDPDELARTQADQQALLQQRAYWQEEAANVYMLIVDRFPDYLNLDGVLYYLGYTLVQMDMQDKAFPYFARIVREAPNSRFVPDALLHIGEYYFNNGRMEEAEKMYAEVENFPEAQAYGLAIYKKGWAFFNMGFHEEAMNQFLKVIDYARSERARTLGYGAQLLREAQRDLVMAYSQVGSPDQAIRVFKAISPTGFMDLAIRLAEGYASQGDFRKSTVLFKKIIAEFRNADDAYRVVEFQRNVLENAYKMGVKAQVVEETRRLIGLLDKFESTAPKDFIDPEMKKAEELVRVIVTTYHKEISVTKEEATMEFTHRLYNEYLRLFPDSPEFAAMTLNYAILLEQLKKYAEAAERYTTVANLKPDADTARDAAHGAVRAYYQLLDVSRQKAKSEDSADLEPKELPDFESRLVAASERYLQMASPDSPDVVEAQYAAAMVLYQHNQFRRAADGFRRIATEHGEHPNAPDAARLLLSSLALMRDIPGLNSAADLVGANPRLMQGEVPTIVRRINEQKDFNKCFEFEQTGRNTIAAECFLDYVRRFPGTPLKDRSLINAANNFFKARLVERSLEANQQLVNEMPDSPLSPRALFNIADTYRRLAVYSEAARIYEIFVSLQPKHELTEEALRYATIFRTGLGEFDLAIKDLRRYLQLFPKAQYAASVAQEIAVTLQKQGKFPEAQREFEKWLTQYGKSGGLDLYLRAHLRIGQCLAKQRGGTAKAFEWYARAVQAYEALSDDEKSKVTSIGLSAVAEARFNEGEAILERMAAIKLRLPEKVLADGIAQKIQLVTQAIELLASVEDLGQPNWAIAAWSRRGFAFQELATSIENSPVPGNLNQEQRLYFRQGLGDRALPIWDRAKDSFRRCVELARELKWYNRYSDEAEDALMKLDPEFRSLPDIRPQPTSFSLNQGRPPLMIEKEGLEVPKWDDANLEARIRANAEAPDASAEALYNMGALLRSKGDTAGARTWYRKALAKNPRLANAESRLGVIALDEGRENEAVAQFEKAMQIDPANSIANNYFAAKALRARNHAEAISLARKGLVSDPDSMDAYQILMAAYLDMGLPDVGILVGRNAVGIYGNDGPIQNMLGLILLQTGEVRQAVALFQKAVQDDPNLFDARMNLASVTLGYRDYTTSSEQFRKALELRPKDVNARLGLAVARRGAGAAEEALNLLTSLAREHQMAEPHFNLCLVYQENLGQMEKALESCRTFTNMAGGSHEKAREVQRRIEGIQMTIEAMRDMPAPTPKEPTE